MIPFKIIAVDFDGTLCENHWPEIGEPNKELIDYLLKEQSMGSRIILWTCRAGEELQKALQWCRAHSLYFDEVNNNLPSILVEFKYEDTRKIFAHEYIDDKMCGTFKLPFKKGE
jgi:hypothetical protein